MTSVAPAPDKGAVQGQPPPGYGMQGGVPMTTQPGMVPGAPQPEVWMTRPQQIPGCPVGLEYLTSIDQLLVKQQIELLEVITSFEMANKYKIKNNQGQQVYFAKEESTECQRQCCGPSRGFEIHITDNLGQEVIVIRREFKCIGGSQWCAGLDCCAYEVSIEAPPGTPVGYVRQRPSFCAPKYSIMDADRKEILNIQGPVCFCQGICCPGDIEFVVRSEDMGHEVGKVSKQWGGLAKEMFTDADSFGVTFPIDLDVKMKAVMIGAVFLIDFMFFEQPQRRNQNRGMGYYH